MRKTTNLSYRQIGKGPISGRYKEGSKKPFNIVKISFFDCSVNKTHPTNQKQVVENPDIFELLLK